HSCEKCTRLAGEGRRQTVLQRYPGTDVVELACVFGRVVRMPGDQDIFSIHSGTAPTWRPKEIAMNNMKRAAQYIRMSTDRQDLSPEHQKEAIAAYAAAREIRIVASYEDLDKSSMTIAGRESLKRLIRDVTGPHDFGLILVYDVSRWGRFQDVDEAAYYEYHCRRNGVQVRYVAEQFDDVITPMASIQKYLKRVMAAEYSRELGVKSRAGQDRVVAKGFQMGRIPCIGYRRVSVSADGQSRTPISNGYRKLTATDRIAWVLGPEHEVELVRRIFRLYAARAQ